MTSIRFRAAEIRRLRAEGMMPATIVAKLDIGRTGGYRAFREDRAMNSNGFEAFLGSMENTPKTAHLRAALIEVADIVHGCKAWFESNGLQATAADVLAMAKLVLEREVKLKAEAVVSGVHPSSA
jgi:hypothetical protein